MSKCSMQKKIEAYGGADIDHQRFGKWADADKERLGKWVDKWIDQYNDYAKLAKFKDTAERDSDIHGLPSIKFDQGGYVVAADPLGNKWKVKFGSNVVPVGRKNVASILFTEIDRFTSNRHKSKESNMSKCSMQKKKESLAKKNEDIYGVVRVAGPDIAVKVQEVTEHPSTNGYSLTVDVPHEGAWFVDLAEFKSCVDGLAENCNGYPTIYREDSDIVVDINAPVYDDNGEPTGDYEVIVQMRCSTEITNDSLQGVVDLLNE